MWFAMVICKIDFFLMSRVAMPVAHWIDYRFHRSPYQQAWFLIGLAQALNIAGALSTLRQPHWTTALTVAVSVFLHFTIFRDYRRKLEACQRQFERRPDMICREQYYFLMLLFPPARLLNLFAGLIIMGPLIALAIRFGDIWGALTNSWVFIIGIALYVAGVPPPQRPRRKKKVWALMPGLPQGA